MAATLILRTKTSLGDGLLYILLFAPVLYVSIPGENNLVFQLQGTTNLCTIFFPDLKLNGVERPAGEGDDHRMEILVC